MAVVDRLLVAVGALLSLMIVSLLVAYQESQLSRSETLYLALAPVDPRSLVQGDFMRLRYAVEDDLRIAKIQTLDPARLYDVDQDSGTAIVALDERRVASFVRIDGGETLAADERRIAFVQRDWQMIVASRAYLFQEGTAEVYAPAKYGILALMPSGTLALTGLADEHFVRLGPPPHRW